VADHPDDQGLFATLRARCAADWESYTRHEFVRRLADGTLPRDCFRHYLAQDYLFLIQFARAYGLAAYKSDTLDDIRAASRSVAAIVDTEMALHVAYCGRWGITEAELAATPEASATVAYTRYVLEAGMAGDLLDLHVALAPCVVGYGEIGRALAADPATVIEGNDYAEWIEMYAGADYQEVAAAEVALLDRLAASRGGARRLEALVETFGRATRLETRFWDMGLTLAD